MTKRDPQRPLDISRGSVMAKPVLRRSSRKLKKFLEDSACQGPTWELLVAASPHEPLATPVTWRIVVVGMTCFKVFHLMSRIWGVFASELYFQVADCFIPHN